MNKRNRVSEMVQQTVFTGPAILFFAIIVVLPFMLSIYYSFMDWNGISSGMSWVGLKNFEKIIFDDVTFHQSFWFTFRYTLMSVIGLNLLGFALAFLLTRALKTRNILRTVFFVPNVIGGLLLGFIWHFIFVNGFTTIGDFTHIGFFEVPWLGTSSSAFWAMVIVTVWQYAGYLMVIYIAAIMNIPKELIEASKIDGANFLQQLRSVIVPMIMPAVTVCIFLSISWCFKVFDVNLSLTNGGPYNSTESVALNIYKEAFNNNRYGLGTAKSLIFFVVVAFVTTMQVIYTKRKEVEA